MITKMPVAAETYGGYVNVPGRTSTGLAADPGHGHRRPRRAVRVRRPRDAIGAVLVAAATAGTDLPATPTAADVAAALWTAAGSVFAATKGQGRLIVAVAAGHARPDRPDVRAGQPAERPVDRVLAGVRRGAIGPSRQSSVVMSAGSPPTDARDLHGGGRGVRGQDGASRSSSRRSGCPGRLRRLLRAAGDRGSRDRQGRQQRWASYWTHPNRQAVGLTSPRGCRRHRRVGHRTRTATKGPTRRRSRRRRPRPTRRTAVDKERAGWAYGTVDELKVLPRIDSPSRRRTRRWGGCLEAATPGDRQLPRTGRPLRIRAPAFVIEVSLERAVEHWKAGAVTVRGDRQPRRETAPGYTAAEQLALGTRTNARYH